MIVLGIDPSSTSTGYGAIDCDRGAYRLVEYGCIRARAKDTFAQRLALLYDRLGRIVAALGPDAAAIESSFYGKDADAAGKLGEARGVVRLALQHAGMEAVHYTPTEVKKAVVGRGQATKEQVQFMVARLLELDELPRPLDASDALGVAVCHIHRANVLPHSTLTARKPEVEELLKRVVRR